MNGHNVRQDDGSDETSTTTVVATVDLFGRAIRKIPLEELLFDPVHFLDCRAAVMFL